MSNILRFMEQGPGRSTEVLPMEAGTMLGVVGRGVQAVREATYAMYPDIVADEDNPQPVAQAEAGAYDAQERSFVAPRQEYQQIGQVGLSAEQPVRTDYANTYGERSNVAPTQRPAVQAVGAAAIPGENLVFGQEATVPQQPTGPSNVYDIAARTAQQTSTQDQQRIAAIKAAQFGVESARNEAA